MPKNTPNPRNESFYFALAQVGLEMVAPMVIGILLDRQFGWTPWATVSGFAFGFVGGFLHLLVMLKQHNTPPRQPPGEVP
jgi:F0F1-type ATP synthase assembly protein I